MNTFYVWKLNPIKYRFWDLVYISKTTIPEMPNFGRELFKVMKRGIGYFKSLKNISYILFQIEIEYLKCFKNENKYVLEL